MSYLWRVACRNLRRNRLRSLVSILAIAAAVMIVVFMRGFMLGLSESTFRIYIDNFLGHVRITDEEYRKRESLLTLYHPVDGFAGEGLSAMLAEIREVEGVEHLLPRLKFGALAVAGEELVRMTGVGVEPEAETAYGALTGEIREGRMVRSGGEILVGRGLLEKLGAGLGDKVTLLFSDSYNSFCGRTFTIVGIRDTGLGALDNGMFFLPLAEAQDMLHLPDAATEIMVMGSSLHRAGTLRERLAGLFAEGDAGGRYAVLTWTQADPLMEYLQVGIKIYDIIYIFLILLGCTVVFNTMFMIIRERTAEIGMMSALGLQSGDIMKIFLMEGAVMGMLGSLLGIVPGGLLTYYLSRTGIHYYSRMVDKIGDVVFSPVCYPVLNLQNLFISFLLGAVLTTITCLWPAGKAARLDPVVALRREA